MGGFGVAKTEAGSGKEKWETQRKRERGGGGGTSGNGSIESAAQRNAPPLLWSGSFAGAPPRPRASEREKENDGAREGEMEKEREREKGTDGSGRETDVYPPTNTDIGGGRREESQAKSRWARSGLPEFHTHRALLRVPSRREENHTKAEAQPLHERENHPVFASGFSKSASKF